MTCRKRCTQRHNGRLIWLFGKSNNSGFLAGRSFTLFKNSNVWMHTASNWRLNSNIRLNANNDTQSESVRWKVSRITINCLVFSQLKRRLKKGTRGILITDTQSLLLKGSLVIPVLNQMRMYTRQASSITYNARVQQDISPTILTELTPF